MNILASLGKVEALTLNFNVKKGAAKYPHTGRKWPAGLEFETPDLVQFLDSEFSSIN